MGSNKNNIVSQDNLLNTSNNLNSRISLDKYNEKSKTFLSAYPDSNIDSRFNNYRNLLYKGPRENTFDRDLLYKYRNPYLITDYRYKNPYLTENNHKNYYLSSNVYYRNPYLSSEINYRNPYLSSEINYKNPHLYSYSE